MNTGPLIIEATIAELHEAICAGNLTSKALVKRYLGQIKASDRTGTTRLHRAEGSHCSTLESVGTDGRRLGVL